MSSIPLAQQPLPQMPARGVPGNMSFPPSHRRGSSHAMPGAIRRIRQACTQCRYRKVKCSGERPMCVNCQRAARQCQYEPYSSTTGAAPRGSSSSSGPVPTSQTLDATAINSELLNRIKMIESQLAQLRGHGRSNSNDQTEQEFIPEAAVLPRHDDPPSSQQSAERVRTPGRRPSTSITDPSSTASPRPFTTLPPYLVTQSLVDTYFLYVHNQPYSYFEESSFRERLQQGLLPKCLVLAVLGSAVRFSDDEFFRGAVQDATYGYAREAWLSVLNDHMTTENCPNLQVAQASNILAIIDFTSGRTSSGWLKIGMAIRIAQDLQLMHEPENTLPALEQEERRRTFWSIYLVDKLISCSKGRPPAITDDDCHVQLPCDGETFKAGTFKKTEDLHDLLGWNTDPDMHAGNFRLSIIAASTLGRCNRYVFHRRDGDDIPPWDSRSTYASIESQLLSVDRHLRTGSPNISDIIGNYRASNGSLNHSEVGHLIFAHAVFHACHCLLNHPFLVRLRLRRLKCKAPPNFILQSMRKCTKHAKKLASFMDGATAAGCHVNTSFYAYVACVAGSILSLMRHNKSEPLHVADSHMADGFQQVMNILERMGSMWDHASRMHFQLMLFDAKGYSMSSITDPEVNSDVDKSLQEALWLMIDYNAMSDGSKETQTALGPSLPQSALDPSSFMDFDMDFDADGGAFSVAVDDASGHSFPAFPGLVEGCSL